jgi:multiple sugar transport system permease protein
VKRETHRELRLICKGGAFLSPWLIGFGVFTLVPLALVCYYSLCRFTLLQPPKYVGVQNYIDLVHDELFWLSIRNTFVYAAIAIPSGLFVSLGLAMLLNVKIPGQGIWRTIIFFPSLVPTVSTAMLWIWLLNAKLGLINILLGKVGIAGPPWLSSTRWALPALAMMSVWGVGHAVVIYLAGLQDVPTELYEAAELDGAGILLRMRHITLPVLSPVIFFNLVMALIGMLQVFDVPYIMTAGGPAHATYFVSMYLYDNAFLYLHMGYASAMAWVMLLIVLVLTAIAFWSSRRWVHYQ